MPADGRGCDLIQTADEESADQRVEVVGYKLPGAGHGGDAATRGSTGVATAAQRLRPYTVAFAFVALAVAQGVLAQLLGWDKLDFRFLVLMGVAAAVWYAGPGPGVLAVEVVKRTEQASLLDPTHDPIFVRDMNGVVSYWNHGAQESSGARASPPLRAGFRGSSSPIEISWRRRS